MTNIVPGVRARDIPSSFPRTMTDRTTIGEFLSSAKAADILLYVHEHPCCRRSDVYRDVSRGSLIRKRLDDLIMEGLLDSELSPFIMLTEKGCGVLILLEELELILKQRQ